VHRRIPIGPLIGAVGALVVIVSLFLDWYQRLSGFTIFEVLDLVLVALGLATIASFAGALGAKVPAALEPRRSLVFAIAAIVVVASQLLNDPPAVATDLGPPKELGIWLAFAGSAMMVAGALLATAQVSLAVDVHQRRPEPARPASEAPTATEPAATPSDAPRAGERP
jgi:hypothetical protein